MPFSLMQTLGAVTFGGADWATWLILAFASGLAAAFIMRPQGAGCFGFGCFGNLLIGGIGAIVGNFIVGRFYSGTLNIAVAFAISLMGALLVLAIGQAIDRLLRRNAPPEPPPTHFPPTIIDSTAREVTRDDAE
ncbi:MAG: GlsB/YeaQ/YmgE family stress response membrane protein [Thermomicrobiales bacterium]